MASRETSGRAVVGEASGGLLPRGAAQRPTIVGLLSVTLRNPTIDVVGPACASQAIRSPATARSSRGNAQREATGERPLTESGETTTDRPAAILRGWPSGAPHCPRFGSGRARRHRGQPCVARARATRGPVRERWRAGRTGVRDVSGHRDPPRHPRPRTNVPPAAPAPLVPPRCRQTPTGPRPRPSGAPRATRHAAAPHRVVRPIEGTRAERGGPPEPRRVPGSRPSNLPDCVTHSVTNSGQLRRVRSASGMRRQGASPRPAPTSRGTRRVRWILR
jgi:hypothetical protein